MRSQSLGAAGTVAGSRHLIETGGRSVRVDCGMFQGLTALRARNLFLVHGEPGAADALRVRIADRLGIPCVIPQHRETVTLT